ncbi:hypothetical protein CR513_42906, partial [Mucuna pruriens]
MVISVMDVDYKVERVLVDQGSSTNRPKDALGESGVGLQSNVHLLKLDPRQIEGIERPQSIDDLKEI